MPDKQAPLRRWLTVGLMALFLAACGGGGGSSGSDDGGDGGDVDVPGGGGDDARSGNYTLFAADGQEYLLTLDFEDRRWLLLGAGVNTSGSFAVDGSDFAFVQSTPTVFNSTRFRVVDDGVVGSFAFPGGIAPFLGARTFRNSIPRIVGTYNLLGRTVDGGAANTTIQQGEITTTGQLRLCNDPAIFTIADCPAASVATATITVNGDAFLAQSAGGTIAFRVADIAGEPVFLRASASTGTARRFMVGTLAGTSFAAGNFRGGATDGSWGDFSVSPTGFTSNMRVAAGSAVQRSGTVAAAGAGSLGNLLAISTTNVGGLFAIRGAEFVVLAAARDNASVPGYFAIGSPR